LSFLEFRIELLLTKRIQRQQSVTADHHARRKVCVRGMIKHRDSYVLRTDLPGYCGPLSKSSPDLVFSDQPFAVRIHTRKFVRRSTHTDRTLSGGDLHFCLITLLELARKVDGEHAFLAVAECDVVDDRRQFCFSIDPSPGTRRVKGISGFLEKHHRSIRPDPCSRRNKLADAIAAPCRDNRGVCDPAHPFHFFDRAERRGIPKIYAVDV